MFKPATSLFEVTSRITVLHLLAKMGVSREKGFHKAYLLSGVHPFSVEESENASGEL